MIAKTCVVWVTLLNIWCSVINGETLTRFPDYFQFGGASAAYQVEGAWNVDGKGENIWDRLTHLTRTWPPTRITSSRKTCRWSKMRAFSISWSRILPNGDTSFINAAGIQYYNNLIDELLANGIEPMVTMLHFDLPQPLQELGGMTNSEIIYYFEQYANVLYQNFGDRVKTWITFNEPYIFCDYGYGDSFLAPLVKSPGIGVYLCTHNLLLAHAKAYDLYRRTYSVMGGRVGITMNCINFMPKDATNDTHVEAAKRAFQFNCGLYAHPIFSATGGYPQIVVDMIGSKSQKEGRPWSRLPTMSPSEAEFIRGSSDFFGLNYYVSNYAEPPSQPGTRPSLAFDQEVTLSDDPSWPRAKSEWLTSYPDGLRQLLNKLRLEYNNPEVLITENGWSDDGELQDQGRIDYFTGHLAAVLAAIGDGCFVTAHTAWSVMDNFEWIQGYSERFGIYHVNFTDPARTRTPKASVAVLRNIYQTQMIPEW